MNDTWKKKWSNSQKQEANLIFLIFLSFFLLFNLQCHHHHLSMWEGDPSLIDVRGTTASSDARQPKAFFLGWASWWCCGSGFGLQTLRHRGSQWRRFGLTLGRWFTAVYAAGHWCEEKLRLTIWATGGCDLWGLVDYGGSGRWFSVSVWLIFSLHICNIRSAIYWFHQAKFIENG